MKRFIIKQSILTIIALAGIYYDSLHNDIGLIIAICSLFIWFYNFGKYIKNNLTKSRN